ncbi:hypothetical protein [Mycobacterium sp. 236(2023)]|uniref:hypothetical protein n=1 Tax=Mycobacterium sp. 236(2023) TaxID=3038163 RepID=UPI002415320C|nr:hypothetical protein [Mycobacterium sp. 236(2023)]MDG4667994.1 hypothetical protein [Mycobacterium sp. 236(2023)]
MGVPLKWSESDENVSTAERGKRRYTVSRRADGQWVLTLYSLFTGEPDKLGDYLKSDAQDAKDAAQNLADQSTDSD